MKGSMSLLALLSLAQACLVAAQGGVFQHSVASGDPTQDSIILWTRITPPGVEADGVASNGANGVSSDGIGLSGVSENGRGIPVTWELADNEDFANAVSGVFATRVDRDYTVNVDVQNLEAGMQYYYRFSALGETSPVGRTKTFPGPGDMRSVKIALASCSNWDYGYFHAYEHMTEVEGLDLVIHVGDYIYEYESIADYGSALGTTPELAEEFSDNRPENVPFRETVTLRDYRSRYAQYRTSPRLQELHRLVPMIAAWDDHEITNNAWKSGAENHDPSEGDIGVRSRAAVRAYLEWMPIRRPRGIGRDIYREFQIGDLATLVMLETRLTARTKQIELQETPWALTALVSPEDLPNGVPLPDQPGTLLPVEQAAALTLATYSNPNSSMIGETQLNDLTEALAASGAAGTRWQIVAGQTVMAPVSFPSLVKGAAAVGGPAHEAVARQFMADIMDPQFYMSQGMDNATAAQTAGVVRVFLSSSDYGLPYNPDAWDGYTYERSRVLEAMQQAGVNAVYLAGDTHNAWAFNIQSEQNDSVVAAVEFDCTSITSPGLESVLAPQLNGLALYFLGAGLDAVDMGDLVAAGGLGANSDMMYSEPFNRGYTLLEVGPESLKASYWFMDSVFTETYEPYCDAAFIVTDVREGMTPTEC